MRMGVRSLCKSDSGRYGGESIARREARDARRPIDMDRAAENLKGAWGNVQLNTMAVAAPITPKNGPYTGCSSSSAMAAERC